ncbi:hypothetical protein M378DRAFT_168474, partial [Amanita muscaria Koide BX008]
MFSLAGNTLSFLSQNELETLIMLSRPPLSHPEISPTRRGIALTPLTRVKNPANLARALCSPHPFISGANAESLGERLVDPSYLFTEDRWEHRRGLGPPEEPFPENGPTALDSFPTGTVGAVALDSRGCIAAVTSTGGRTNKLVAREEWTEVGSGPRAIGVSSTGDGAVAMSLN